MDKPNAQKDSLGFQAQRHGTNKSNRGQTYRPLKHGRSVMRDFLESGDHFTWPPELGGSGNHCVVKAQDFPLTWKRKITDEKTNVDVYEPTHAVYTYDFKRRLVIKTVRKASTRLAMDEAQNEVENMKYLRHPHITILLGTLTFRSRMSILIFPAACCDLKHFMEQICNDSPEMLSESPHLDIHAVDATRSVSSIATNSSTGISNHTHNEEWDNSETRRNTRIMIHLVQHKTQILQQCFICLSEALSYLHASGVRHKDIKPGNILIDESGSLTITDFGISRRFPEDTSHCTNDQWKFTPRYASPEIMKGKTELRDDPSDVFSLGCVFLEVATVLLGEDLKELSKHYTAKVNDTEVEMAYHCNLPNVYSWIDSLKARRPHNPQGEPLLAGNINIQDRIPNADQAMVDSLHHIRKMLDEDPQARPESQALWKCFQDISPEKCVDCDPRLEERWKSLPKPPKNAETGPQHRRSMTSEDASSLESRDVAQTGKVDSNLLSAQGQPIRGLRENHSANTSIDQLPPHQYTEMASGPSSRKHQAHDNGADSQRSSKSTSPPINIIPNGPQPVRRSLDHQPTAAQSSTPHIDSVPEKKPLTSHTRNTSPSLAQDLAIQQPVALPVLDSSPEIQDLGASQLSQDEEAPSNTQIIVYDASRRKTYQTNSDLILG